jgi:hypothetical protein
MSTYLTPKRPTNYHGGCRPSKGSFDTLQEIVRDYIENCRAHARKEFAYFGNQPDLHTAIKVSALAIIEKDEYPHKKIRHPHQRRIPRDKLDALRRGLWRRRHALRRKTNFAEIMKITETVGADIWKNSKLTVYDTAHRIGAHLNVRTRQVYIHAGVAEGAKALGFDGNETSIHPDNFPKAFRGLLPDEIEDCLCIYKKQLKRLQQRRKR